MPLDKRRPLGHFVALWTTFAAGFCPARIGVTLGIGIYFAYALFGAISARAWANPFAA